MHGTAFSTKNHLLFLSTVLSGKAGENVTSSAVCKLPLNFQSSLGSMRQLPIEIMVVTR
jgi:hypothetical protein